MKRRITTYPGQQDVSCNPLSIQTQLLPQHETAQVCGGMLPWDEWMQEFLEWVLSGEDSTSDGWG